MIQTRCRLILLLAEQDREGIVSSLPPKVRASCSGEVEGLSIVELTLEIEPVEEIQRIQAEISSILQLAEEIKPKLKDNSKLTCYINIACNEYSGFTLQSDAVQRMAKVNMECVIGIYPRIKP